MNEKTQLNQKQKDIAEWWIRRFIPTITARNHIRRLNGLLPKPPSARAMTRMQRWDIRFESTHTNNRKMILRCGKEARWASGIIELSLADNGNYHIYTPFYVEEMDEEGIQWPPEP